MSHRSFAARRLASLVLVACISTSFAPIPAHAEDAFRVGDKVEILCTCFGPMEWVEATIEAMSGPNVVARYGAGKYHTKPVSAPDTMPKPGSAERAAGEPGAPDNVTAKLDGTVLTNEAGTSSATVQLPAGYALAGCHLDACCTQ